MIPKKVRTWIAIAMFAEANLILVMIALRPELAEVKLFEILAQAIVIQGLLGLVLAFYFSASDAPPPPSGKED
jgi:alkylhydroperoxidase/carboxymuconolactone decarboxylase family protein YurZ